MLANSNRRLAVLNNTASSFRARRQQQYLQCISSYQKKPKISITENDYKIIKEIIPNKLKLKTGNALFLATHAKNVIFKTKLIFNNLSNLKLDYIENIIIVISANASENLDKFIQKISKTFDKNLIFIRDNTNKYYDFGKYKIAYDYFIKNNMVAESIHLMNDSFIICEKIDRLCYHIQNEIKKNDLLGIVMSLDIQKHSQSWWLVIKNTIYEEYINNIRLIDINCNNLNNAKEHQIFINEVYLSNRYIENKKIKSKCLFHGSCGSNLNLFFSPVLYSKYWQYGFYIIKFWQANHHWSKPLFLKYCEKINSIKID
jgi:hypothetical protein